MWWIIMAAILALVVAIFLIVWIQGSGGKAFDVVDTNIAGTKDCDGDKVADFFDKCVCDAAGEDGKDGCPKSLDGDELKEAQKLKVSDCKEKKGLTCK